MGLMNKALMARMGWKLVTEPDSLWASILGSKYLNNSSFFNCEANSKSSYTWRSILIFQRGRTSGSKWVIWNGQRAKFWLDWWVGEGPLVDIATQQIPPASLNARVFDYIDEDGNWKLSDFVELISMNLIPHIRAIIPFQEDNCTDSLIWRDSPSGNFSTKSAYALANNRCGMQLSVGKCPLGVRVPPVELKVLLSGNHSFPSSLSSALLYTIVARVLNSLFLLSLPGCSAVSLLLSN